MTFIGKTFLAGLAQNWHIMSRYIVKHRATMHSAMVALGMPAPDIVAVEAAFTAILAADAAIKTISGY